MKTIGYILLFIVVMFLLSLAAAWRTDAAELKHTVPAYVESVYDGDTFTVRADIWPNHSVKISVRIMGIDTPEIRGACTYEIELAKRARDFLKQTLFPFGGDIKGNRVWLIEPKNGKYAGRVVATVLTDEGFDVATLMIHKGYARPYDGKGPRKSWCIDDGQSSPHP